MFRELYETYVYKPGSWGRRIGIFAWKDEAIKAADNAVTDNPGYSATVWKASLRKRTSNEIVYETRSTEAPATTGNDERPARREEE